MITWWVLWVGGAVLSAVASASAIRAQEPGAPRWGRQSATDRQQALTLSGLVVLLVASNRIDDDVSGYGLAVGGGVALSGVLAWVLVWWGRRSRTPPP